MAYDLIDLKYGSKPKDCCYFFDSNILLRVLGLPNANPNSELYLKFFNAVYVHCLEKPELKIYTCTNQLSEIFNILMNFEMQKIFGEKEKIDYPNAKKFFKDVFRPSANYERKFELYKQEFLDYSNVFEVVDLGSMNLADLLTFNVKVLDFNDQVILQCVIKTGATLVSDDADFYGQDIQHATLNGNIIKRYRERIATAK